MEPEEQSPHQTSRIVILVTVSIILIVVAVFSIVSFARRRILIKKTTPMAIVKENDVSSAPSQAQKLTGRVGVMIKGTQATFRRGQVVTLYVYADSQAQEITGFDAVLRYNPKKIRFESVKSILEGMDVYETEDTVADDASELIITGIQGLGTQSPFVLNNTALAEVSFTVLAGGEIPIEVVYEPGSQRETNLITTHNEDIVSNVVGLTLKVL